MLYRLPTIVSVPPSGPASSGSDSCYSDGDGLQRTVLDLFVQCDGRGYAAAVVVCPPDMTVECEGNNGAFVEFAVRRYWISAVEMR